MLNETLSCSADANVQPSAVGCGKNTHDLRAKLNRAWPAARRGGFEGDSEDLTLCIFAIIRDNCESACLLRKNQGHGFFKPRNLLRAHTNRSEERRVGKECRYRWSVNH